MGLASKLAAAQGAAYIYNQSQNQQPPGHQPGNSSSGNGPGGYPGNQQQYQQYPPQQPQGQHYPSQGQQFGQQYPPGGQSYGAYGQYPQQGQYPQGQYPPPGPYGPPQQQYGGPPPSGSPQEVASFQQILERHIQEKQLQPFYPPGCEQVRRLASLAPHHIHDMCQKYRLPFGVGRDLVKIGLYDVILYIDDSGSMELAGDPPGDRINDLRLILHRVTDVCTRFDTNGIDMRFMNSNEHGDGIRSENDVNFLMNRVRFNGVTPLGTMLRQKVIDKMVIPSFRNGVRGNPPPKPVLIITITDGEPNDRPNSLHDAIEYAVRKVEELTRVPYAIEFEFAQVGNDIGARKFLSKLDTDPRIGSRVDCTSNYEQESDEMMQQNPPVTLTPDLWMMKLLLGAIDPSYDNQDEHRGYKIGPYGAAPPPQQPYDSQSGAYPPPGNNQPYGGYAPQSGFPQQQHPTQIYQQAPPQQQQYGYGGPQQHGGYSSQPQGYLSYGYGPPQQNPRY